MVARLSGAAALDFGSDIVWAATRLHDVAIGRCHGRTN